MATMVTKNDLMLLGFGTSQSADIIRKAKALMVGKGYGFYSSRKLGRVPAQAIEEILGIEMDALGEVGEDAENLERLSR